jgi:exopolysaccharide biosynthesis predicted pyruvyltransferase EpsI
VEIFPEIWGLEFIRTVFGRNGVLKNRSYIESIMYVKADYRVSDMTSFQEQFLLFVGGGVLVDVAGPSFRREKLISDFRDCQIFIDTIYVPKQRKLYQITTKLPKHCNIFQMAIKYSNIFHS